MQRWLIRAGRLAEAVLLDRGGRRTFDSMERAARAVPGARGGRLHPGVPPAPGGVPGPAGGHRRGGAAHRRRAVRQPACGTGCARVSPRSARCWTWFAATRLNWAQASDRLSRPRSARVPPSCRSRFRWNARRPRQPGHRRPAAGNVAGAARRQSRAVAGAGGAGADGPHRHPGAAAGAAAAAGAGDAAGVRADRSGGPAVRLGRAARARSGWPASSSPAARPSVRRSPPPWAAIQHRARGIEHGFRLVSFSVDPSYDTPERLAAYARQHRASPRMWKFLTGPLRAA